jgi:hypothetical protein
VKYVGGVLALACLPVVLVTQWVSFPISNGLAGISFSIFGYARGHAHPTLWSYGALAALLLICGSYGCFREKWKLVYCAGAALFVLLFAALLDIAFGAPLLLKVLAEEADWQQAAAAFTHNFLAPNPGGEPVVWSSLSLVTPYDRMLAGWYFLGFGWYLALTVAVALAAAGLSNVSSLFRRRAVASMGLVLLLIAFGFTWWPSRGERHLTLAARAEGHGRPEVASIEYRSAMQADTWNALELELYRRIGAIDAGLGRTTTREYKIYQAEVMVEQHQLPNAIAEYEALASSGGSLGLVATTRVSGLWTEYGLDLYEVGAFGDAVAAWQRVLAREPSMWLAAFYLARGYFAVGRYQEAVNIVNACLDHVADPVFRANLYSDYGDAHMRLGNFGPAHQAYWRSYHWDFVLNQRGLSSVAGP